MNGKIVKAIGILATAIGIGVDLISDWVDEKKMDKKIEEKVNEALTVKDKENEKES